MSIFREVLSGNENVFVSAGLVALIILALWLLRRVLERNARLAAGRRFRSQVVMTGVSLIAVLLIILALPVSESTRGNLLSLVGILLSATIALSSTTLLGNAMAGIMLKSLHNFRTGDFIRAGEHFGRVTERGLFHTEIQTLDRDLTTLPNLLLATGALTVIRQSGTIIGATVSLGYDAPHAAVETLLLQAATETGLQDPFVQVLELGDYAVTYRVAGLLTETRQIVGYRSRLRTAMLDALHTGGVEIVSPAFINTRNYAPRETFIPAPASTEQPVPDAAPVEVVFDKAEEAESLSSDQQSREDLQEELKRVEHDLRAAPSAEVKDQLTRRIGQLRNRIASLEQRIAEGLEKENEPDP